MGKFKRGNSIVRYGLAALGCCALFVFAFLMITSSLPKSIGPIVSVAVHTGTVFVVMAILLIQAHSI